MESSHEWSVYEAFVWRPQGGIWQLARYAKVGSQEFFYGSELWRIQCTSEACEVLVEHGFIRPVDQLPNPREEAAAVWDASFKKISGNDGPDMISLKRIEGRDFGVGEGIFELLEIDEAGLSALVRWNLIELHENQDGVDLG